MQLLEASPYIVVIYTTLPQYWWLPLYNCEIYGIASTGGSPYMIVRSTILVVLVAALYSCEIYSTGGCTYLLLECLEFILVLLYLAVALVPLLLQLVLQGLPLSRHLLDVDGKRLTPVLARLRLHLQLLPKQKSSNHNTAARRGHVHKAPLSGTQPFLEQLIFWIPAKEMELVFQLDSL